jgi:amino acid transporter
VFSALGRHNPSAGGVIGYVTAGLGARARAWPPAGCSWPGWCAAPRSSASSAPATSPT